jgi:hypothetical protein
VRIPAGQVTPVWYVVANMNPALPFTGTGRICSITFEGLAPGTSLLDLTYAKAANRDGDTLYPVPIDGIISVLGEGSWHKLYLPLTRRH